MIRRKQLLGLAALTLFGFGGIGLFLIREFADRSFPEMLRGQFQVHYQLFIGILYGTIAAWTGWNLIKMSFMQRIRQFYINIIGSLRLRTTDIILVSLCAGIGEEILFRGGIQPLLGLWLTSIVFVALHGYLNPMNWRMSIYGIFMTVVIAGIGKLYDHVGAVSAFAAHTMIDIYLLWAMTRDFRDHPPEMTYQQEQEDLSEEDQ